MIRLLAPAKINLSFEVTGRRDDGFHEVRTVLQAINLADVLEIEEADEIQLIVDPVGSVPMDGNLVIQAAEALRAATGVATGAAITLTKRIPVAAGLGGGSSDAAAALLGLRRLWGVDQDKSAIYRIATGLGSDVPFFLNGGTALGTGRGDALELLPMPVERFAVVVTPRDMTTDDAKTSRLYGLLKPQHFTDGSSTDGLVSRIENGLSVGNAMRNTFAAVAADAHLSYEAARFAFATTKVGTVLLAGAGPSLFALLDDESLGELIAATMERAGYESHVAQLLGPWSSNGFEA